VASRVEGLTKVYGVAILITESVRQGAADLALIEVDLVRVVGRSEPVPIYTILGDSDFAKSPAFQALAEAHGRLRTAYRNVDFAAAETALAEARGLDFPQLARLFQIYAERLARMRQEPPVPGWDGVYVFVEK
jgi:adenylate cyclase